MTTVAAPPVTSSRVRVSDSGEWTEYDREYSGAQYKVAHEHQRVDSEVRSAAGPILKNSELRPLTVEDW